MKHIVKWRMWWVWLADTLRHSVRSYHVFIWANTLLALVAWDESTKIGAWIKAYRFGLFAPRTGGLARQKLGKWTEGDGLGVWSAKQIGWNRFSDLQRAGTLTRTVVLKSPGTAGEKGVLLTCFEYNWHKLLRDPKVARKLEDQYDIVFSSSSSPGDYAMLGLALATLKGPVYVMACHYGEIPLLEAFHPRVKCLPMLPCDWIDPSLYKPKPSGERSIDILMVASWGPVKRHWHFFDALRSLPKDLRVVLVGQPDGPYDRDSILALANRMRVPQDLTVFESLPVERVAELQCESRVSAVFSRREGCCVAVTESMMADSPVALLASTHMGPASYINEQTGCFLPLRNTGAALGSFLDRSGSYKARDWAIDNISNRDSARKLDEFFQAERQARGEAWSGGLVTPAWRPYPEIPENERQGPILDAFRALHQDFPELFAEDLIETSRF